MKLVIEIIDHKVYAYIMSEKHFKSIDEPFEGEKLTRRHLAADCNLDNYNNCHWIFNIK